MNLFELSLGTFKFPLDKPIKLFECFAGIGTTAMALKRIVEVEHVGMSEIDKFAIQAHEAIHGEVENFGDITTMGGVLPETDILTYTFPCQDLSKAGQKKGMDVGTRSGLVWEVIRLLRETAGSEMNNARLPKVLVMENVVDLVSQRFVDGFNDLQRMLEELGYTNWNEILNAKDYGVAQTRARIFMVSIQGTAAYSFPKPFRLEKKLKDYLEQDVDEKYFISEKMFKYFTSMKNRNGFVRGKRFKPHTLKSEYAFTITTSPGNYPTDNFIIMPEKTTKGYAVAMDGDGVYLDRPHQKRGVVQKGLIQTIKTQGSDLGVVVKDYKDNSEGNLRIRKLTPLESWRLMGIDDETFYKAKHSDPMLSDTQLYKQAGNAIVVDVLYHIFKNLFEEEQK